ncbi:hypothetical protein BDFB_010130, partial [Asbolus verrucosus]
NPHELLCVEAVQQLREADYPVRVEYCRWFLNTPNENLLNLSFITDEAGFYLDVYVNSQNMRWWSSEKLERVGKARDYYANLQKFFEEFMTTKLWTLVFNKTVPLHMRP